MTSSYRSIPNPSAEGIAQALEGFGLRVNRSGMRAIKKVTSPVPAEAVEPEAVLALIDAIRAAAEARGEIVVTKNTVKDALIRLCSFAPWC